MARAVSIRAARAGPRLGRHTHDLRGQGFLSARPARGRDHHECLQPVPLTCFYPRGPRGAATFASLIASAQDGVSIRAARAGPRLRLGGLDIRRKQVSIRAARAGPRRVSTRFRKARGTPVSIRAARAGPRRLPVDTIAATNTFLSARPARGRDNASARNPRAIALFLSARPARGRDNDGVNVDALIASVSIRAARAGPRLGGQIRPKRHNRFYPRGPRGAATWACRRAMRQGYSFLSARPARGRDRLKQ